MSIGAIDKEATERSAAEIDPLKMPVPKGYKILITLPTPVVDEQTKAAAMRAAATDSAAAARTIAKTPNELMIDRINAQIAKTQTSVSNLENVSTELAALNPSVMTKFDGESNSAFLARKKAAEKLARENEIPRFSKCNIAIF